MTSRFKKTIITTFISLILLVMLGSIVRTTGSGLGCPDWPHCFGQWIPPFSVTELPLDYKTRFSIAGREVADFNATKTWIEYINRLLGVIVGLEMIWLVCIIWPIRQFKPSLFKGSLSLLILTCIQGAIGARVVRSHLAPHLITLHMVLALIIVLLCLSLVIRVSAPRLSLNARLSSQGKLVLGLGFIQLILGTEVREGVDRITNSGIAERALWLDRESWVFLVHRSFSIVIFTTFILWVVQLWKEEKSLHTRRLIVSVFIITLLTPITGIILSYFSMPAFAQPTHLVLATLFLSGAFALVYRPHHHHALV